MLPLVLLCPVPVTHLVDALETCGSQGVLAFGSNATDVAQHLRRQGVMGPLQVFIFPMFTGVDAMQSRAASELLSEPRTARFAGRLRSIVDPVRGRQGRGQHPNPDLQTVSTIAGFSPAIGWELFWEVEGIVACDVPLSSFVKIDGTTKFSRGYVLRGATLARPSGGA